MKRTGDTFTNDEGIWEILKYDDYQDSYVCKKINGADHGEGTTLQIFVEGQDIILRKYTLGCHYCGEMNNLTTVLGVDICPKCLEEFKNAAKLADKIRK